MEQSRKVNPGWETPDPVSACAGEHNNELTRRLG